MKKKQGFVLRDICGEHVIVAEGLGTINFGKLISLNETAAWLWRKAEELGDFTAEALTEALCDDYEVAPEQARTDVDAIIAQWLELGIIE